MSGPLVFFNERWTLEEMLERLKLVNAAKYEALAAVIRELLRWELQKLSETPQQQAAREEREREAGVTFLEAQRHSDPRANQTGKNSAL
jgi:hypothetical protein